MNSVAQTRKHKDIKCPKCGSSPNLYKEVWSGQEIQFCVTDGSIDETGAIMEPDPVYVIAECGNSTCNHNWKLRGVSQITQIQS